jgi:hypothetical protein
MLDVFKIFMYDLLSQRLARKTLLVHRDHICTLGETIVQRLAGETWDLSCWCSLTRTAAHLYIPADLQNNVHLIPPARSYAALCWAHDSHRVDLSSRSRALDMNYKRCV